MERGGEEQVGVYDWEGECEVEMKLNRCVFVNSENDRRMLHILCAGVCAGGAEHMCCLSSQLV